MSEKKVHASDLETGDHVRVEYESAFSDDRQEISGEVTNVRGRAVAIDAGDADVYHLSTSQRIVNSVTQTGTRRVSDNHGACATVFREDQDTDESDDESEQEHSYFVNTVIDKNDPEYTDLTRGEADFSTGDEIVVSYRDSEHTAIVTDTTPSHGAGEHSYTYTVHFPRHGAPNASGWADVKPSNALQLAGGDTDESDADYVVREYDADDELVAETPCDDEQQAELYADAVRMGTKHRPEIDEPNGTTDITEDDTVEAPSPNTPPVDDDETDDETDNESEEMDTVEIPTSTVSTLQWWLELDDGFADADDGSLIQEAYDSLTDAVDDNDDPGTDGGSERYRGLGDETVEHRPEDDAIIIGRDGEAFV